MDKYAERLKHFKAPPVESRQSQEARRAQALEHQKLKRTRQIDSFRQLDQFSSLNLDDSDDSAEDNGDTSDKSRPRSLMNGAAQFPTMLQPSDADPPPDSRSPSPFVEEDANVNVQKTKKKKKSRGKRWAANKCMYAELLELREDTIWSGGDPPDDGLPNDLETSWVGLAPVPVGKRCLAVSVQNAGLRGVVPNTVLRSRLLGKVIIRPFPSPLPPSTILDCILDENWRTNGILHVLDVVRWKGQDVSGCEANFRFWWRDTRLAEVPIWPLPAPDKSSYENAGTSTQARYIFPYPTTLLPIPYIAPLPFEVILGKLLDKARRGRTIGMNLPAVSDSSAAKEEMEIDSSPEQLLSSDVWAAGQLREVQVPLSSDGLLLYVGEAAYESGETPLSVWIPCVSGNGIVSADAKTSVAKHEMQRQTENPLDTFERLVRRRLLAKRNHGLESSVLTAYNGDGNEVDMTT